MRAHLEDVAQRATLAEMLDRLSAAEQVDLDEPSADAVRAGRGER